MPAPYHTANMLALCLAAAALLPVASAVFLPEPAANASAAPGVPPLSTWAQAEGVQHEVLFLEVGAQGDDTRKAVWMDADNVSDALALAVERINNATTRIRFEVEDVFGAQADAIEVAFGAAMNDTRMAVWNHAAWLDNLIVTEGVQTRLVVNVTHDIAAAVLGAQTNQSKVLIVALVKNITDAAAALPGLIDEAWDAYADIKAADAGAQAARLLIEGLGPQVAEDLKIIAEDFNKTEDFAAAEVRGMRLLILQSIARVREEIDDRDARIKRSLDVIKSNGLLNSLLIERNREALMQIRSSDSSTSLDHSTSRFTSFRQAK